jgi:hypothetical protein
VRVVPGPEVPVRQRHQARVVRGSALAGVRCAAPMVWCRVCEDVWVARNCLPLGAPHRVCARRWGLQNEPAVGPSGCIYSCCGYNATQYYTAFKAAASAVKVSFPDAVIHVSSWSGQVRFRFAVLVACEQHRPRCCCRRRGVSASRARWSERIECRIFVCLPFPCGVAILRDWVWCTVLVAGDFRRPRRPRSCGRLDVSPRWLELR